MAAVTWELSRIIAFLKKPLRWNCDFFHGETQTLIFFQQRPTLVLQNMYLPTFKRKRNVIRYINIAKKDVHRNVMVQTKSQYIGISQLLKKLDKIN